MAAPRDPDAPEIRRAFEAAWEDPAFAAREPGWLARTFADLRERFFEFVRGLLPELDLSEGWAAALGQVLVVLLVAGVVLALAWAAWVLLSNRRKGEGSPGAEGGRAGAPVASADEWARRAEAAARAGDWRRAALFRYRSVVVRLVAAGHLRPREGRTPGDHLRELTARTPALAPDFRGLVAVFHPVAFGPREPAAADYHRMEDRAGALLQAMDAEAARVEVPGG